MSQQRKFRKFYKEDKLLKRGAFGEAATVISKVDGVKYVMKKEHVPAVSNDKRREEILALKKCNHENIVKYFDAFYEEEVQMIVMEFCPGKCLKS